jgi:saccharopine dehydrogenase (NAD+, L-lysine-forming)
VLENVGMTSIQPINYQGMEIQPLKFLKAVLPAPSELGENYHGQTSIGCQIRGVRDGHEQTYYVYNNCDHAECYREVEAQAVSYTTGVPAMIGAMLMLTDTWKRPGVWNVEQFDPDPFMEKLNLHGLPWHEIVGADLAFD